MNGFVLDASVAAAWLMNEPETSAGNAALARLEGEEARVPQLWHLELRNCLLVAARRARKPADASLPRLDAPLATLDKRLARAAHAEGLTAIKDSKRQRFSAGTPT